MPATSDQLFAFLAARSITTETVDHPPVFTVQDARGLRGTIPGAHTKNLFLRDNKRRFFLVTLEEDTVVDLKRLRPLLGARGGLSFASPEALMEHLGVLPGSVSPFAALNDKDGAVTVAVEQRLTRAAVVNGHPLVNTKTTSIAAADLLSFLRATGHEPLILDLADADRSSPESVA